MPFGLTNAPATFQESMNNILREFLDQFVVVYLDDILIFSRTKEEDGQHLRKILEVLRRHQFYAKLSQCEFCRPRVEFVGFRVSKGKIEMMEDKVKAVTDWPTPTTLRDLRGFIGLISYYRRFIRNLAKIMNPLTSLLKKESAYSWTPEHEEAFQQLKTAITTAPVLRSPDYVKPFSVVTDASDFAIGATLFQEHEGKRHPVAFESRKLKPAELNYPVHEKEQLAGVYALGNGAATLKAALSPSRPTAALQST